MEKTQQETEAVEVLDRARGFWEKNSRMIMVASSIVIVLIGGYLVYKYMFQAPDEAKAADAIYKAEINFRKDSLQLALNGRTLMVLATSVFWTKADKLYVGRLVSYLPRAGLVPPTRRR